MKTKSFNCLHDFIPEIEHNHPRKNWFIHKCVCGLCGKIEYTVLTTDTGEYVGRISDGSDCTFSTLSEAKNYA